MRKSSLSAVLAITLLGTAVAGAGVVGTVSIAAQLISADPVQWIVSTRSTQAFVDGRIPIRLHALEQGSFRPATNGTITFVRNGQVALQTDVLDGGTIQAQGLPPGPYSVFVHGREGYAAFATLVGPPAGGPVPAPAPEALHQMMSVGLVPPIDMPTVLRLIGEYQHSEQPISVPTTEVVRQEMPVARTQNLVHGDGFELSADGTVRGRVIRFPRANEEAVPFRGVHVFFIRANAVVAQAVTDVDGLFQMQGMGSGPHTLVVAGDGYFLAMCVPVRPAQSPFAQTPALTEVSLVAFDDGPPVPEVAPVPFSDFLLVQEYWQQPGPGPEAPEGLAGGFAGGTGGGYGGGGGAYGGGGGGLAALLGLGALGLGIYAVSDDDDVRFISPARP